MAAIDNIDVFYDERVLLHDTGVALHEAPPSPWLEPAEEHTEGPGRLPAMVSMLRSGPVRERLVWHDGRLATEEELARVHSMDYIDGIRRLSAEGGGWVTGTTRLGAGSYEPLLAAAGTALAAAAAVMSGEAKVGYALVRPPGHHAQIAQADGYCFFNHAALAADYALRNGAERVLVVDWDVHHGNGTQDIFYSRNDVLSVSIHMNHGAWGSSHPQTGWVDEIGLGDGHGYNINVPLPLGAGDSAYLRTMDEIVAPLAQRFKPSVIVAASGQDASAFDPNGRHNVTMAGYRGIGARLVALADEYSGGRLIAVQEGGYNRSYAPYCLLATLEGILGVEQPTTDPLAYVPDQTLGVDDALLAVRSTMAGAWPDTFSLASRN